MLWLVGQEGVDTRCRASGKVQSHSRAVGDADIGLGALNLGVVEQRGPTDVAVVDEHHRLLVLVEGGGLVGSHKLIVSLPCLRRGVGRQCRCALSGEGVGHGSCRVARERHVAEGLLLHCCRGLHEVGRACLEGAAVVLKVHHAARHAIGLACHGVGCHLTLCHAGVAQHRAGKVGDVERHGEQVPAPGAQGAAEPYSCARY